ncbi:MAG: hypothetical protein AB1497_00605 [Bacillota bacterium]
MRWWSIAIVRLDYNALTQVVNGGTGLFGGWCHVCQKVVEPENEGAESYRDPETGQTRHRLLMNISKLPSHVIEAIDQSLKQGRAVVSPGLNLEVGDTFRGAGLLAVYRAWKQEGMDDMLGCLTMAERESVLAMVVQRILDPGSKLALQEQLRDTQAS